MTQPILSASSSVTSRPSIPASHLPANTRVPPEAISSSRRLDLATDWYSEGAAALLRHGSSLSLLSWWGGGRFPAPLGAFLARRWFLPWGNIFRTWRIRWYYPPRGGTASTSSSATGEVGALSSLLLLPLPSSHNK